MKAIRYKDDGFIYLGPPKDDPKRNQMITYATWRMRIYQELESISRQQLQKKTGQTLDKLFPKLSSSPEQTQFYVDFLTQFTQTLQQDRISHFICRMLYSRDLKNHDTFIKMEKLILSLKLDWIKKGPSKMSILKNLVSQLASIPIQNLMVFQAEYRQNQLRITRWYEKGQSPNQNFYMKIPFQFGEAGLKKRKCYIHKGFVYADIQTSCDIVLSLYASYLKERLLKIRNQTEKILQNDMENQLKPFMDRAISSINSTTIEETQLNSEFRLNLKNIDAVSKKYFPPCMAHLNRKLKQNNHLKHDGRRQLWLFFKGCGMDVNDNKQYFSKYFSIKVSNSDMKNHLYNIEHAYGLVGKKQQERPKMCRAIITGTDPKKDEHHGCPFKHWSKQALADFLHTNYSLNQMQTKQILQNKADNYYQIACGRLFEANFKPETGDLPQQITAELGKSPHQYFIAGMTATQWINTKTLRPTKTKPVENEKMQLQF